MMRPLLFAAVLVTLTACDPGPDAPPPPAPGTAAPKAAGPALPASQAAPQVRPLIPAGPAATVQPSQDMDIQHAASVVKLDMLTKQGGPTVKLFGTAGGDPAMNGLYTDIAFFRSSAEGWAVFRIGDVLDYRILSERPGRVDLRVQESVMDEATGHIGRRDRRLIISWTPAADEAPPAVVTVTPAR